VPIDKEEIALSAEVEIIPVMEDKATITKDNLLNTEQIFSENDLPKHGYSCALDMIKQKVNLKDQKISILFEIFLNNYIRCRDCECKSENGY